MDDCGYLPRWHALSPGFQKGENVGGLKKEPFTGRRTGSVIRWKPDTDVFTDINVPADTFKDMLRRQALSMTV